MAARKKAKAKKKGEIGFSYYVWNIILLLFSLLSFVALMPSGVTIAADYSLLSDSGVSIWDVITLRFPDLVNPIGPYGVVTATFFSFLVGKPLAIAILLCLASLSLVHMFFRESGITPKVWAALLLSCFVNHILLTIDAYELLYNAKITGMFLSFNLKIFKTIGSNIIAGVLSFLMIMVIFGAKAVIDFIKFVFASIGQGLMTLFRSASESGKKDKKKPEKTKKEKDIESDEEIIDTYLIEDHTDEEPEYDALPEQIDPIITDHSEPVQAAEKKIRKVAVKPVVKKGNSEEYEIPDIETFLESQPSITTMNRQQLKDEIAQTSNTLKEKLLEFGVEAHVINVNIGPIITQYEVKPAPGVKVSRFSALADDLALAIKAKNIRIQAPIPGRGLIGIEVPNKDKDIIYLKDILLSQAMEKDNNTLSIGLGKDISGNPVVANLAKMPHLLIAGATGAGKSVCINTIINSLLLRTKPEDVRLVMIDPKRIELSGYEGIPHLIQNVVTDPDDALIALNWAVAEMERRYQLLQKYKVRDIKTYNKKIKAINKKEEEEHGDDPEYIPVDDHHLPYIVIVVDEFADLIMTAGKEIEMPIARLAQMARAIGIHLLLATQRPSSKVITGIIKANFPARIAFQVSSKVDSRVILDENGAERLLGRGDMLFLPPGKATPQRIHGAYMSDDEIENVVEYLKQQPHPDYQIEIIQEEQKDLGDFDYDDELFPQAARAIVSAGTASVSMLQRHFKVGYARAGRLIDLLEQAGVVGPHVGSKSREVLATEEDLDKYGW